MENGSILRFNILPVKQGKTSIQYEVVVFADAPGAAMEKEVFSTTITFVHVDGRGQKQLLPKKKALKSDPG